MHWIGPAFEGSWLHKIPLGVLTGNMGGENTLSGWGDGFKGTVKVVVVGSSVGGDSAVGGVIGSAASGVAGSAGSGVAGSAASGVIDGVIGSAGSGVIGSAGSGVVGSAGSGVAGGFSEEVDGVTFGFEIGWGRPYSSIWPLSTS